MSAIPTTFVLPCLLGPTYPVGLASKGRWEKRYALALADATAVGKLLERGERARSSWTLESELYPVAISSNISGIVHLGQFDHRMRNCWYSHARLTVGQWIGILATKV
jgi:hypothetical protein